MIRKEYRKASDHTFIEMPFYQRGTPPFLLAGLGRVLLRGYFHKVGHQINPFGGLVPSGTIKITTSRKLIENIYCIEAKIGLFHTNYKICFTCSLFNLAHGKNHLEVPFQTLSKIYQLRLISQV